MVGLHLAGRALDEQGATHEAQHPVAQVEDEPHVVLDDDHGQAAVPDLEDQVHRRLGLLRVHARERAQELLDYVGLSRSTELLARNMPYGDQRLLEIARALATDPQILLLDEPTAGMNPKETEATMNLIFKIRDSGLAVVVIEHDMRFIFNLCDRVLCLVRGTLLVEGTPGEVQSDHRVIEAYIGGDDEEEESA